LAQTVLGRVANRAVIGTARARATAVTRLRWCRKRNGRQDSKGQLPSLVTLAGVAGKMGASLDDWRPAGV